MKVGELIQRVQSVYNIGIQKDRSPLRNRHIYNKLVTVNNMLVFQKLNKKQKLSSYYYTTLPCIKLVKAPLNECPCVPPSGCIFLRTEYPLPDIVDGIDKNGLISVVSLDGNIVFTPISESEVPYMGYSKYKREVHHYLIKNKYLYILSSKAGRVLSVTGLFADPIKALDYKGLCSTCESCEECIDPLEVDFPAPKELEDTLVKMTLEEILIMRGGNSQQIEDR